MLKLFANTSCSSSTLLFLILAVVLPHTYSAANDSLRISAVAGPNGLLYATGAGLARAGDFNGDFVDDFIVSAHLYPGDPFAISEPKGAYFIVFGKPGLGSVELGGLPTPEDGVMVLGDFEFTNAFDETTLVTTAGDMNGDGLDDVAVLVSTNFQNHAPVDAILVIFGRRSGGTIRVTEIQNETGGFIVTLSPNLANLQKIKSLTGGIDINNDGYDDVLFGIPSADTIGMPAGGKVFILLGGPSLHNLRTNDLEAGRGGFAIDGNGQAGYVTAAGDFNNDGIGDFAMSSPFQRCVYIIGSSQESVRDLGGRACAPRCISKVIQDFGNTEEGTCSSRVLFVARWESSVMWCKGSRKRRMV